MLIGSYMGLKDADDNSGKVAVTFIEERTETTDTDWTTFSDSLPGGLGHMTVDILGKATFSIRVSPLIERRDLPR